MAEIKVIFYEVSEDGSENEKLVEFDMSYGPAYEIGKTFSFLETDSADQITTKQLADLNQKPTHQIVKINAPVIVYTKNPRTGEKVLISEIFIYHLQKINP